MTSRILTPAVVRRLKGLLNQRMLNRAESLRAADCYQVFHGAHDAIVDALRHDADYTMAAENVIDLLAELEAPPKKPARRPRSTGSGQGRRK